MLWTEKYQPKGINELKNKPANALKDFILNFKKQTNKAILIEGPSGCGKTSAIYALAKELNYEIYELNASHFRNKESIINLLGNATKQFSLFKKGKIILIDEVDGLSRKDRGAIQTIIKIIEETNFPIFLTANNLDKEKLDPLKKKCRLELFLPHTPQQIFEFLKEISEKENIKYREEDLRLLSRYASGDLRAAIIDLQTLVTNKELKRDIIENLSTRDKKEEINQTLIKIFKNKEAKIALESLETVSQDLMDFSRASPLPIVFSNDNALFYWIEENLPREYKGQDLINAYNHLSKADIFYGRIRRQQYWRLLHYISISLSAGVSTSKQQKNPEKITYKKTRRSPKQNFRLWGLVNKRKSIIASKIASKTHTSKKRIIAELPYLKTVLKQDRKLQEELQFEKQDIDYLAKL